MAIEIEPPKIMLLVLSRLISIDEEWAAKLIGLRMRVPDNWWYGCTGSHLRVLASGHRPETRIWPIFGELKSRRGTHRELNFKGT